MSNITYIDDFIDYLNIEKRYSSHTLISYKNDLNQFNNYLIDIYSGILFKDVKMFNVRSYMVELLELNLAKSSVARKISAIKSFYKFLIRKEILESSPVHLLEIPKLNRRLPTFIKEEEIMNLFNEFKFENNFVGKRDKLLLFFLYQTGIRLSEIIGLNNNDVRFDEIKEINYMKSLFIEKLIIIFLRCQVNKKRVLIF